MVAWSPAMSIVRPFSAAWFSNAHSPYLPMSATAIICSTVSGASGTASWPCWIAGRNEGSSRFSMKNTGGRTVWEGNPRPRIFSSTSHLLSKGGAYRRVNDVVNALPAGDLGEALALLLFALNPCLPRVLHREHSPRTRQRSLEGGRIVQVARHDLGPELRELPGCRGVRLARHRANLVT